MALYLHCESILKSLESAKQHMHQAYASFILLQIN